MVGTPGWAVCMAIKTFFAGYYQHSDEVGHWQLTKFCHHSGHSLLPGLLGWVFSSTLHIYRNPVMINYNLSCCNTDPARIILQCSWLRLPLITRTALQNNEIPASMRREKKKNHWIIIRACDHPICLLVFGPVNNLDSVHMTEDFENQTAISTKKHNEKHFYCYHNISDQAPWGSCLHRDCSVVS